MSTATPPCKFKWCWHSPARVMAPWIFALTNLIIYFTVQKSVSHIDAEMRWGTAIKPSDHIIGYGRGSSWPKHRPPRHPPHNPITLRGVGHWGADSNHTEYYFTNSVGVSDQVPRNTSPGPRPPPTLPALKSVTLHRWVEKRSRNFEKFMISYLTFLLWMWRRETFLAARNKEQHLSINKELQ